MVLISGASGRSFGTGRTATIDRERAEQRRTAIMAPISAT